MNNSFFTSGAIAWIVLLLAAGCSNSNRENSRQDRQEPPGAAPEMEAADYVEQAEFLSLDGDTVSISDFRGKVVLIDFWETWCKPCLASFPTLQKLMDEYPEHFVVLAVTPGFSDTRKDAEAFAEQHDYDFTYLMDDMGLSEQLGVMNRGIPYKVFVGPEGQYITESLGSYGPESDYKMVMDLLVKHTPVNSN